MPTKGMLEKPLPPHGTRERYQHRIYPCRCAPCRAANSAYQKQRRSKIPKTAVYALEFACRVPGCGALCKGEKGLAKHKYWKHRDKDDQQTRTA